MRRLAAGAVLIAALAVRPAIVRSQTLGSATDSLEALAREYRYQLRYDDAIGAARELLRVWRNDRRSLPHQVEDAEWFVGHLERLASLPESSRRMLARADSLERRILAGLVGNQAGAGPAAEEWLATAEAVLGPRDRELILIHANVGRFHYFDGNYDAAERHLRTALKLTQEILGRQHPFVADCYSNLAVPLILKGDLAGAEVLLRDALERKRRTYGPRSEQLIETTNNLAAVLEREGDDLGAEELARASIDLTRIRNLERGMDPDNLNTGHFNRLARVLRRKGDLAGAEHAVREAIRMDRTWSGHPSSYDLGVSFLVLGDVLVDRGDLAGALDAQGQALEICRALKGEQHADVANYMTSVAETRLRRGEGRDAGQLLRRALDINRRTLGNLHPQTCRNLLLLGRTLERPGTMPEAEATLAEAAAAFDATRLSIRGAKRAMLPLVSPYPELALARLAVGRSDDAWTAAERGLARTLAELLVAADRRARSSGDIAREDSLAHALTSLEDAFRASQDAAGEEAGHRAEAVRSQLVHVEASWAALQEELAARYPIAEGGTYPLERIQTSIPQDAALVGWLEPPDHAGFTERWAYVIRARGPVQWVRLPATEAAARTPLRADLDEAASWPVRVPLSEDVVRHARSLWDEYLAPLQAHLQGVNRLYLIASGRLLGVPIEAAQDAEGRWVIDRFTISYAPSATVHAWLKERKADAPAGKASGIAALLVGDPPYSREGVASDSASVVWRSAVAGNPNALDRLPRLPGSRDEILRVKHLLPFSQVLLGREASEEALVRLASAGKLARFRILHFATHALVDDRSPERSALVLSRVGLRDPVETALGGGRVYDGVLRAVEITREWRLDADLVTLSGCRTGLGREAPGEGYLGLAHAFLQVGARSLLVSLWEVDDQAAALFMGRFYENLTGSYTDARAGRRGAAMGKADALREAKHWLRTLANDDGTCPYEHPVYWSPFVLIGDPG